MKEPIKIVDANKKVLSSLQAIMHIIIGILRVDSVASIQRNPEHWSLRK